MDRRVPVLPVFRCTSEILVPRESFLLRTDPKILQALRRWSEDELRSTNGQLDFILRKALKEAGRFPKDVTARPGGKK